jgi:hypothetical protein
LIAVLKIDIFFDVKIIKENKFECVYVDNEEI